MFWSVTPETRTGRDSALGRNMMRPMERCHGPCAMGGMTDKNTTSHSVLPHHKLVAYRVAVELLLAVKAANVRDAKLRDEATRAAKSACLNAAEVAPGKPGRRKR